MVSNLIADGMIWGASKSARTVKWELRGWDPALVAFLKHSGWFQYIAKFDNYSIWEGLVPGPCYKMAWCSRLSVFTGWIHGCETHRYGSWLYWKFPMHSLTAWRFVNPWNSVCWRSFWTWGLIVNLEANQPSTPNWGYRNEHWQCIYNFSIP